MASSRLPAHRIRIALMVAFSFACGCLAENVEAQQIETVTKTTAGTDSTPLYEVQADPDDPNNLILCGAKLDAKDNALYGFVSSSSDGGKTWREAMADRSSDFVSETSCAFGTHGVAYYIADASKDVYGEMHHEWGTTRIYVSHDSGKTWKLGITTGWTDYCTSVVDRAPGPNQNRLYILFNNLETFYTSISNKDASDEEETIVKGGTRLGLISYREGDSHVMGPFTSPAMAAEVYNGSFPAPSFIAKDGSIVALFSTRHQTNKGQQVEILSIRANPGRDGLEAPTTVVDSLENAEYGSIDRFSTCGDWYLSSGGAYDATQDKLYFVFPDVRQKKCGLWLTSSTDGGKTWSKAHEMWSPSRTTDQSYANPAIAIGREGMLGVMWQKANHSDCWMFGFSTDGGGTLSRAEELGTCGGGSSKRTVLSTAGLYTSFIQSDPKSNSTPARIEVRDTKGTVWNNKNSLVVSRDGTFHPAWVEGGSGDGKLRTAAVRVRSPAELISAATQGLDDVSSHVVVLYGGNQFYDSKTGIVTIDVTIKNNGDADYKGRFKLGVTDLGSVGRVQIVNAENKVTEAGSVWDFTDAVGGGVLSAGATSKPFSLKFHCLIAPDAPRESDAIFGLGVKVFATR